MYATRFKDGDGQRVHPRATSVPQRVARSAAIHPWRVVAAWGLALIASVVAIGSLIGSAFTSDGSITTHPDSMKAGPRRQLLPG
jgi:RND superfamily putative drug exporter